MCTCTHACSCICSYVCLELSVCLRVCVSMCSPVYMYTCMCVLSVYVCMYVFMFVCIVYFIGPSRVADLRSASKPKPNRPNKSRYTKPAQVDQTSPSSPAPSRPPVSISILKQEMQCSCCVWCFYALWSAVLRGSIVKRLSVCRIAASRVVRETCITNSAGWSLGVQSLV